MSAPIDRHVQVQMPMCGVRGSSAYLEDSHGERTKNAGSLGGLLCSQVSARRLHSRQVLANVEVKARCG